MIDFNGQVAVVTGAGRGLGRLYALELARRGASVVVNDLGGSSRGGGADMSVAETVVAEIESAGGAAVASSDSVATPEGGKAIVEAALDTFGRVDVVINNAGIIQFTPFEHITVEDWRATMDVHINGAFYVSQPAFVAMKRQGYGRFVFISSSAGMFGQQANAHYGTAKAGVFGLKNVLALEGAPYGILANALLPTGQSRMVTDNSGGGEPAPARAAFFDAIKAELILPMVIYLASKGCAINRQNIAACAGRYSNVFVGYGEGWLAETGDVPTAEDIESRIDQIGSTDGFVVPNGLVDEIVMVCRQRGIELEVPGTASSAH